MAATTVVGYTTAMELVVLIALGLVVALVAIDAIRRQPVRNRDQDSTTQKIIVDLSRRR